MNTSEIRVENSLLLEVSIDAIKCRNKEDPENEIVSIWVGGSVLIICVYVVGGIASLGRIAVVLGKFSSHDLDSTLKECS